MASATAAHTAVRAAVSTETFQGRAWSYAGARVIRPTLMAPIRRPPRRGNRAAPVVRKNTVRLLPDVAARVRAGHPWVYREALGPRPLQPEPGTVIDLVDADG